jgi:hypothetical protein
VQSSATTAILLAFTGLPPICNLTKEIMPPRGRHPKLRLEIAVLFWLD